jgi:hypothetical protein
MSVFHTVIFLFDAQSGKWGPVSLAYIFLVDGLFECGNAELQKISSLCA